jgi:phosphatidylinositol alpha 1,6-mannosyltransferase
LSVMRSNMRPRDDELRVLIFTACYFVLDGVSLTVRRLASHLRSHHAIVKIVTCVPDDVDKAQLGDDIIIVPSISITFNHVAAYALGSGLPKETLRDIERFKPNIVHFTCPDFVGLDGINWCQKNNIAYVGTWHSNYVEYLKFYYIEWVFKGILMTFLKGFYEQIPYLYVPSQYMINKMNAEEYGVHTKLVEWGRGVDMKLFNPANRSAQFRASKNIGENDVVVLWVGRLVPEKRPDIWFEVLERLTAEGFPVKGLVVGNGDIIKTLTELTNVKSCGWLSGAALGEAYASSDILLFPSAVETFGNVTLEALASGCVPIVEQHCGCHLVTDRSNGFTCPDGDVDAYYAATKALVEDVAMRRRMSQEARKSSQKFDRNIVLQAMAENYKDAIVRHQDPTYINEMLKTPMIAGQNAFSVCCCHYYFVKAMLTPFMNSANYVKGMTDASAECLRKSTSKLNLGDYMLSAAQEVPREDSRFEDPLYGAQKQGPAARLSAYCNPGSVIRLADMFASVISYAIVVMLLTAAFLV